MKKVIFLLLLFIGVFAFSDEYTEKEKNIILTQFVTFQKAVTAKDIDTLNKMIKYPLEGYSAEEDLYLTNTGSVSQKEIIANKKKFLELIKDVTWPKVNLKNNTVKTYEKGNVSVSAEFLDDEGKEHWGYTSDEKVFFVTLFDDDPEYPGVNNYIFTFENNKLKLAKVFGMP